jgi:hypothetical protein
MKYILELEVTPSMVMGILPSHKNTTKIQRPTFYNNFKSNRKRKKGKCLASIELTFLCICIIHFSTKLVGGKMVHEPKP